MTGAHNVTTEKHENQDSSSDWSGAPRFRITNTLAAWSVGNGPNLVLLHGVGLNADAWTAQIETLSAQYRLIAIDMPGHGDSERLLQNELKLADYGDCIVEAIDTLDAPVFLAGHSMGALIALDIAIRYPQRVAKVIALNAIFQRSDEALRAVQQRAAALSGMTNPNPTPTLQRWFADEMHGSAALACREWLETVDARGYQQAYRVFANESGPSADDLADLSLAALFMTGAEEPNSTPEMSRAMAALTPRGRAAVIEGAAHMMPMTHAAAVNQSMLEFLAGDN